MSQDTSPREAKHTPGPWLLTGDRLNPIIQNGHGHILAEALSDDIDSVDEAYANARLIAAAPELLGILVAWMDRLEERLKDLEEVAPGYDRTKGYAYKWERLVRAAIARATGGAA